MLLAAPATHGIALFGNGAKRFPAARRAGNRADPADMATTSGGSVIDPVAHLPVPGGGYAATTLNLPLRTAIAQVVAARKLNMAGPFCSIAAREGKGTVTWRVCPQHIPPSGFVSLVTQPIITAVICALPEQHAIDLIGNPQLYAWLPRIDNLKAVDVERIEQPEPRARFLRQGIRKTRAII